MQIHRLISLAAAGLITLFIARFFTEETHVEPAALSQVDESQLAIESHIDADQSHLSTHSQTAADRS